MQYQLPIFPGFCKCAGTCECTVARWTLRVLIESQLAVHVHLPSPSALPSTLDSVLSLQGLVSFEFLTISVEFVPGSRRSRSYPLPLLLQLFLRPLSFLTPLERVPFHSSSASSSAMWSSEDNSSNRYTTSSSSKSSSTSSSSSPFSPSLFTPRKKTMEDVWKDINLTSFQDPPRREDAGSKSSYRRTILQEFLARPFGGQPHPKSTPRVDPAPDILLGVDAFASNPPPATALSLNSGPEFRYLDSPGLNHSHPFKSLYGAGGNTNSSNFVDASAGGGPFDVIESSLSKRRMTEPADKCVDRRHKRMIKNRESAARSRARKQAYTNELELEVANLLEENAKLRKQQQQQQMSVAAPAHLPQRRGVCRTLTAPF